jgi:predicted ATPase
MQGRGDEGLAQVNQGIAAWRATGATVHTPYFYALLADVSAHLGHPEDGLQALAEAHTLVEQHDERYWEAEIARLRGALLLRQPGSPQSEAETWLQRALDVACRQEATSLELRAAMSLGGCGRSRASKPKRGHCWHRSMAGSPRALAPPISRRLGRCWSSCRESADR